VTKSFDPLASADDAEHPDWEQAWHVELDQRTQAADARTPPARWAEVRARILAKLAAQ